MSDEALARLPHGEGFRFLRRTVTCEPGRTGSFHFAMPPDHPILRAHFPGHPIVPGTVLLEAMAQAAGVVWGAAEPDAPVARWLVGVARARFRVPVGPADAAVVHATCERVIGSAATFSAEVRVGGRVAAEAELTLARAAP